MGCIGAFNVCKPALENGDFGVQPIQLMFRRLANEVQPVQVGGDIKEPFVDRSDLLLHVMFRLHHNRACAICAALGPFGAMLEPDRLPAKIRHLLGKFIEPSGRLRQRLNVLLLFGEELIDPGYQRCNRGSYDGM